MYLVKTLLPILTFGVWLFASEPTRFIGHWVDTSTANGMELRIAVSDGLLRVHGYGACIPRLCDWGSANGQSYAASVKSPRDAPAEIVSAAFLDRTSSRLLIIRPEGTDGLRVEVFVTFVDNSGRSSYYVDRHLKKAD